MTTERLYLSPPWQSGSEEEALRRAVRSNWIAPVGPELDAFELDLAYVTGTSHAVAVGSGTAAMHIALRSLGVGPGNVVVAPSFTFIGSISPATFLGAEVWLVDSEASSWNLDPTRLEEALATASNEGRRVAAVIAVDLFGQCADYARVESICDDREIPLVEDAAEALGSSYQGRPAGSRGRVAVLSFNGNKIITTSGGGAVVSDDPDLVHRCRFLATQAREPVRHYEHREIGYNYRMSNLLAALGRTQLSTLKHRVNTRRAIFRRYEERLAGEAGISFMPEPRWSRSNRWLTTLTVDETAFGASRDRIIDRLEEENIEARPVWKPMHTQTAFVGVPMFGGSVCESLYEDGLCLPSGTAMTESDVDRVVAAVLAARVS